MKERETKGLIAAEEEEENQDDDAQQHEDEEENLADDAHEPAVPDIVLHEDFPPQSSTSPKPSFDAPGKSSAGRFAKKKVASQQTASAKLIEYLISKQNQSNSKSPHPVDAFLASIGPTLKSLSPYYLNVAKSEIFATVQKYEMEMITNQHSSGKTVPSASASSASTPLPSPPPAKKIKQ